MNRKRREKQMQIEAHEKRRLQMEATAAANRKVTDTILDNSKYLFRSDGTVANIHTDYKLAE